MGEVPAAETSEGIELTRVRELDRSSTTSPGMSEAVPSISISRVDSSGSDDFMQVGASIPRQQSVTFSISDRGSTPLRTTFSKSKSVCVCYCTIVITTFT